MLIYGLKNCDTCRKALKAFPQAQLVDVRKEGVPLLTLNRAHALFGGALINTRSTTWRGLSESEREQPPIDLITANPALMKRPLTSISDELFLGWTNEIEAQIKALL